MINSRHLSVIARLFGKNKEQDSINRLSIVQLRTFVEDIHTLPCTFKESFKVINFLKKVLDLQVTNKSQSILLIAKNLVQLTKAVHS